MLLRDEDIDHMNNLLDEMGVEGFRFTSGILFKSKTILISIPNKDGVIQDSLFGDWISIEDMFMRPYEIIQIVNCFSGTIPIWFANINFSDINNAGCVFLKLLANSSSLKEFEMKLQIMGY